MIRAKLDLPGLVLLKNQGVIYIHGYHERFQLVVAVDTLTQDLQK